MKRPSYAVVSYTLVALSVFGLVVESLRSSIPPNDLNRLRYEKAEFLVQGSRSEVDWRILEPAAFAEARRTGRPILLLIGTPWCKEARIADETIFMDREIVSFLNQYMVCIRIDGQVEPRWLGAFYPVRRASVPMLTGFQIWFLTPEGQLFDNAGEIGTTKPIVPEALTEVLARARDRLREIRAGSVGAVSPGADQAADFGMLASPAFPQPYQPALLRADIRRNAEAGLGGFRRFDTIFLNPNALSYLLVAGQDQALRLLIDATLKSPLVDWLDGGFYFSYNLRSDESLDFDKAAFTNAEMMSALAKAGESLNKPLYRKVAEQTFDYLAGTLVHQGFVAGAQIGDEERLGRSKRNSFSPERLRAILTPEEREIARTELGLRAENNPVMAVRLTDPNALSDPSSAATAVLKKLRTARQGDREFAGKRQLDIHGFVVARLLECASLWGDEKRMLQADELYSRLDWFLAGDDVKHTLEPGISDDPYLGDYLAYADACLQHFLAFGRTDSLEHGFKVLQRARFLFATGAPGVWKTALGDEPALGPQDVLVPEIQDFVRESCSAQAIRLCGAYGRLFRNEAATALVQASQSTAAQFSPLSSSLSVEAAGLFGAAEGVRDDGHLIVVGAQPASHARKLYRRLPTRLVAPAIGSVRPDLRAKGPGVYVVRGGESRGPFSDDEAVARLSTKILN